MSDNQNTDIATLSFEDALKELEDIVNKLEQGQGALDDAIAAYARGAELKKHCQAKLEEARMKVEKIQMPTDGTAATSEPFDT